jgi:hypothetical protein
MSNRTEFLPPHANSSAGQEDSDHLIQGLTSDQIKILAQKIYDLILEETRIESERHGGGRFKGR